MKIKIYLNLLKGMWLTWKHLLAARFRTFKKKNNSSNYEFNFQLGKSTIQYPHEKMIVPEVGRYQLEVMMNDCIVCDLCAKICPVDCIEIEQIRAVGDLGKTSDGTVKKIHAAKFEIDMAKCMYCGLCTTVCPTECIVMTDTYDQSTQRLQELNYVFARMNDTEKAEKIAAWEQHQAEKLAEKEAAKKALKGN